MKSNCCFVKLGVNLSFFFSESGEHRTPYRLCNAMSATTPPTHLILDCDGVLIDSEYLAAQANQKALHECGLSFTLEETLRLFLGKSLSSMREILVNQYHLTNIERFMSLKDQYVNEIFSARLEPLPGVAQTLAELTRRKIPFGVASNSRSWRLRSSLATTGLLPFFGDRTWGVDNVAQGKPAPDLYLFAARKLGADPSRCLVVDDSPTGITAARLAGMQILGFTGANHLGAQQEDKLRLAGAPRLTACFRDVLRFFPQHSPHAAR